MARNKLRTQAITWGDHKSTMLSERRKTQKATYCMIPLIWNLYDILEKSKL